MWIDPSDRDNIRRTYLQKRPFINIFNYYLFNFSFFFLFIKKKKKKNLTPQPKILVSPLQYQ
jgi:hypothetical protein